MTSRGGSRPNSGRKPTGRRSVGKMISLRPEEWAEVDGEAARLNVSRSDFIRLILSRYRERPEKS